jgi:hypothetical protein
MRWAEMADVRQAEHTQGVMILLRKAVTAVRTERVSEKGERWGERKECLFGGGQAADAMRRSDSL